MKTIIVKEKDVNVRIDKFISKQFNNLSKGLIYKFLRLKKIKVNSKKVEPNYLVQLNDIITCFFAFDNSQPTFFNAKNELDICYEDNNIIVVDKPINLLVNDESNKISDTLINRVLKYLYTNNQYKLDDVFTPCLAHRIDQNTSGLVIIAKNKNAWDDLQYMFKNKLIVKKYYALVYGLIKDKSNIIKCYLKKDEKTGFVTATEKQLSNQYKEAITKYSLVDYIANKYSLLDIELITGRTHQIRASFNFIHHPLVGEQKYISRNIDKDSRFKTQCLSAYMISFKQNQLPHLSYLTNIIIKSNHALWFMDLIN